MESTGYRIFQQHFGVNTNQLKVKTCYAVVHNLEITIAIVISCFFRYVKSNIIIIHHASYISTSETKKLQSRFHIKTHDKNRSFPPSSRTQSREESLERDLIIYLLYHLLYQYLLYHSTECVRLNIR